jgi:hypothetical protein
MFVALGISREMRMRNILYIPSPPPLTLSHKQQNFRNKINSLIIKWLNLF